MRTKALALSTDFVKNRISKQTFKPAVGVLELIIWFICISSFISYQTATQYTFTTAFFFLLVDIIGCHASVVGLCTIGDLMASHPILHDSRHIFLELTGRKKGFICKESMYILRSSICLEPPMPCEDMG